MGPEEFVAQHLLQVNQALAVGGEARQRLIDAFNKADIVVNEADFPWVNFDSSAHALLNALGSTGGQHLYKVSYEPTLFGQSLIGVTIPAQTLVDAMNQIGELGDDIQFPWPDVLAFSAYGLAIDTLVTEYLNAHQGEHNEVRDAVLNNLMQSYGIQWPVAG